MTYFKNVKTIEDLKEKYRDLCKQLHPDNGGDTRAFQDMRNEFSDLCKKLKNVVLPDSISTIACWGERRVWKTELDKPFTDLPQHLIKGLEMELNPPAN